MIRCNGSTMMAAVIAMLFDDPTNGIKIVVRRHQHVLRHVGREPTGVGTSLWVV